MHSKQQTGEFIVINRRDRYSFLALGLVIAISCHLVGRPAQAQSAGEMKTVAMVTLGGYDALVEDINFVGSLVGQPQMSMGMEQMLAMFTQDRGLAGLDKSRPIGLLVQSDGMTFLGALCIPVTSLPELLDVLQAFELSSDDQGDGVFQLEYQNQPFFAKEKNGWAFISPMKEMIENLPDDPGQDFSTLTSQYDLGVQINVQNVPEPIRQMAVEKVKDLTAGQHRHPGESDEAFEQRKEITKSQMDQFQRAIDEIAELTVGIALDEQQQRAYLEYSFVAVEGTQLAVQFQENSDPKTNFSGFFQPDAAAMMSFSSKIGESEKAQVEQMFEMMRKQVRTAIDEESEIPNEEARDVLKSACDDFLDSFRSTIQAGVMDGGMVLTLAPDALTLVVGGFVGDTEKVESGLKKIADLAKEEPDFPGVQWDASKHADIDFHTLSVPIPESETEPRQMFGDDVEMAVGIGEQSVFFALGRDCLDAVKRVIDVSAANPEKPVPPMEFTIALGQVMEVVASFADDEDRQQLEMIASMLAEETTGRDHVRMVVQPIPNGQRVRIEVEEGVLRAIGMAVMAAQAQPAGAAF